MKKHISSLAKGLKFASSAVEHKDEGEEMTVRNFF